MHPAEHQEEGDHGTGGWRWGITGAPPPGPSSHQGEEGGLVQHTNRSIVSCSVFDLAHFETLCLSWGFREIPVVFRDFLGFLEVLGVSRGRWGLPRVSWGSVGF